MMNIGLLLLMKVMSFGIKGKQEIMSMNYSQTQPKDMGLILILIPLPQISPYHFLSPVTSLS
jgi:hypothetical protein